MHHHLVVLFTQYTGLRPEDADVSAVHILKWPRVLPIALQQVIRTHARKAHLVNHQAHKHQNQSPFLHRLLRFIPDYLFYLGVHLNLLFWTGV